MYDINKIREDFPILSTKVYGHDLVYFDNAATTQKPLQVIRKIDEGYLHSNANVHRGVHFLSQLATEAHEDARRTAAQYINAAKPEEIVFTRGTTEGINLVASSFGETFLNEGDEVILTAMEHHSNIVPWQLLRQRKGIIIKVVPFLPDGSLDMEALDSLFSEKTKLLSLTHVSNVLGTVNPLKRIVAKSHARGIPVLADAAQSAAHAKIDVQDTDVDFLVLSAHKVYGPTGIGVLYGKEKYLDAMVPYQGGGEMIQRVTFEHTTFAGLPFKFEAGTPDFIGSTAMAEALRYVQSIGLDNIAAYEHGLLEYAGKQLQDMDGIVIYGNCKDKGAVISMNFEGVHPYDLGSLIDKLGIATRTGHHCAQPVMDFYGVESMLRASFAMYNTMEEVDIFVDALKKALKVLR
ncbi:MAG: SufS family cysteine desulfurase [Bacteroidetes bacterium]|uniref:Cysteine desulfurase n=1 Tax=Candidatus Enterocola intestinipullorum TaxID=2840783 RepID=A0A9D9EFX9_9BACT|nr:SufS family cysteine desulfurase [Candidatus Enterocola intestinipullorum]